MVDNIHPMKSGKAKYVVQTLGGMGDPAVQIHANQLTTRLARLTGAKPICSALPESLSRARRSSCCSVTPMSVKPWTFLVASHLPSSGSGRWSPRGCWRAAATSSRRGSSPKCRRPAVRDISLRFFDADGGFVKTPLDDRVIGMSLEELSKIGRVIALAGGQSKTAAIRGALRTGVIDLLITDQFTAARLVGQEGNQAAAE